MLYFYYTPVERKVRLHTHTLTLALCMKFDGLKASIEECTLLFAPGIKDITIGKVYFTSTPLQFRTIGKCISCIIIVEIKIEFISHFPHRI